MSRFMGMIITLLHIAGGALLGYYGHALRLAVEANGATTETATAFYWAEPLALVGLIPVLLAVLFHSRAINKARSLDVTHCQNEAMLEAQVKEMGNIIDEKNRQMAWVEDAIQRAVRDQHNEKLIAQGGAKDYAEDGLT